MAITWTPRGTHSTKAVCTTGTEAAPAASLTLADGLGAFIGDARGWQVIVEADSGQTLSGAGALTAWQWNPESGVVDRAPYLDLAAPTAGVRGQVYAAVERLGQRGRVFYVPTGITVSLGGLTIYINVTHGTDGRDV